MLCPIHVFRSDVKCSSHNTLYGQWLLAMRSFALITMVTAVTGFYQRFSEMEEESASSFSRPGTGAGVRPGTTSGARPGTMTSTTFFCFSRLASANAASCDLSRYCALNGTLWAVLCDQIWDFRHIVRPPPGDLGGSPDRRPHHGVCKATSTSLPKIFHGFLSSIFRPTRAVWHALLSADSAHALRILLGACNPMSRPIHGGGTYPFRRSQRPSSGLATSSSTC